MSDVIGAMAGGVAVAAAGLACRTAGFGAAACALGFGLPPHATMTPQATATAADDDHARVISGAPSRTAGRCMTGASCKAGAPLRSPSATPQASVAAGLAGKREGSRRLRMLGATA